MLEERKRKRAGNVEGGGVISGLQNLEVGLPLGTARGVYAWTIRGMETDGLIRWSQDSFQITEKGRQALEQWRKGAAA